MAFENLFLFAKIDFYQCLSYSVKNRQSINFWTDIWCGVSSLRNQFLSIFMVDMRQNAFISDCFQKVGEQVVWSFNLQRNLMENESNDLI